MKKQFLSTIPELPPSVPEVTSKKWKFFEQYLYILGVFFGLLLLYALARIISLQRRVRDLEARPPVDDITLRGAVRLQLNDLVSDLEQSLRAKHQTQVQNQVPLPYVHDRDTEIDEVLDIANSVKSSLPDLKMFASAIKQQKLKNEVEVVRVQKQEQEQENDHEKVEKNEKEEVYVALQETRLPQPLVNVSEETLTLTVENESNQVDEKETEVKEEKRWATPVKKKTQQRKKVIAIAKKKTEDVD
jgi:hypothetical protein